MPRGNSISGARSAVRWSTAQASVEASAEARRDTLLSSLAEVARDYIQLRGTQAELQIARDNLKSAQQSLELTQQRAAGGVTTDLDVSNAAAQVHTTAAQIPPLEQHESENINASACCWASHRMRCRRS